MMNLDSKKTLIKALGLGASGLLGLFLYSTRLEPAMLKVERLRLRLAHSHGGLRGFRLVQISDIHMGGWMSRSRLERVVTKVLDQNPDVVAITGDFISRHSADLSHITDLSAVLAPLASRVMTVAVLGNHDHRYGLKYLRRLFAEIGICELPNRFLTIKIGKSPLYLAGVDDIWMKKDDLDGLLAKLPAEGPAVLLAHEPDFADKAAESGRFDLQISGHTHGGQVVLPGRGPLVLPRMGKRYPSGLYQVGQMFQYTNRGVGMGTLHFRFNCPPEITVFDLE
jgi:uncharacterized protein